MIIRPYTQEDKPFVENLIFDSEVSRVFRGWSEAPDLTDWLCYVVEGCGIVVGEPLGGGNYIGNSAFLPEHYGWVAGVGQIKALHHAFLNTDLVTIYAQAESSVPRGVANTKSLGFDCWVDENGTMIGRLDFMRWVGTSKYLERESDKFFNKHELTLPHQKMLYAVMACCQNGQIMKGMYQWFLYERLVKEAPDLIPTNELFTRFSYGGKSVGMDGIW
jgi:hypothetical protein